MTDLKPCPCCKSDDVFRYHGEVGYFVECAQCELRTGNRDSEALADKAWNTRATGQPVGCREAFEAVMTDGYDFSRDEDGMYIKSDTFEAFEGFRAAYETKAKIAHADIIRGLVFDALEGHPSTLRNKDASSRAKIADDLIRGIGPYLRTPERESGALEAIKKYVTAHSKVSSLPEEAYLDSTKMDILITALNEKSAAFSDMLDLINGIEGQKP
jgi:hypothetical protein